MSACSTELVYISFLIPLQNINFLSICCFQVLASSSDSLEFSLDSTFLVGFFSSLIIPNSPSHFAFGFDLLGTHLNLD